MSRSRSVLILGVLFNISSGAAADVVQDASANLIKERADLAAVQAEIDQVKTLVARRQDETTFISSLLEEHELSMARFDMALSRHSQLLSELLVESTKDNEDFGKVVGFIDATSRAIASTKSPDLGSFEDDFSEIVRLQKICPTSRAQHVVGLISKNFESMRALVAKYPRGSGRFEDVPSARSLREKLAYNRDALEAQVQRIGESLADLERFKDTSAVCGALQNLPLVFSLANTMRQDAQHSADNAALLRQVMTLASDANARINEAQYSAAIRRHATGSVGRVLAEIGRNHAFEALTLANDAVIGLELLHAQVGYAPLAESERTELRMLLSKLQDDLQILARQRLANIKDVRALVDGRAKALYVKLFRGSSNPRLRDSGPFRAAVLEAKDRLKIDPAKQFRMPDLASRDELFEYDKFCMQIERAVDSVFAEEVAP